MWRYIHTLLLGFWLLPNLLSADTGTVPLDRWMVQIRSGDVSVTGAAGSAWHSVETGQILSAPFTLKTGSTGQATLVRGGDVVLVAPHSEIEVRAVRHSDDGLLTRIMQSIGNIVYQVEKRSRQRFEVETPYLVSVVKGTTFTISVTGRDTAVSLAEGGLEVLSTDGAHRALLKPGEIARRVEGVRGIQVSNAVPQQSRWGAWHPANSRRDVGGRQTNGMDVARRQIPSHIVVTHGVSGAAPGLSESAPGLTATAPGLSGGPPGLTGTAPGLSGGPPGLTGTAPGLSGGPPGLTGTAPGLSGRSPGLSGFTPGLNK